MNIHLKAFEKYIANNRNNYPNFKAGDTIDVKTKIIEDGKVRIQSFQGIVIQRRHTNTNGETFTVRKVVDDIGVEKIFPILSPAIDSINVIRYGKVRRARLFYLEDKTFKKKVKNKIIVKKENADIKNETSKTLDDNSINKN